MKTLFTTDYKNYKAEWPSSCRPSARAVILIEGTPLDFNPNDSSKIILKPEDKLALVYAKNLEQRMNDVKERYGYYPQSKWEKNFELKEYFEKLTGRDLYEIIK